jgi:hypothetical protein
MVPAFSASHCSAALVMISTSGALGEQASDRPFAGGEPRGQLPEVGQNGLELAVGLLEFSDQIAGGVHGALDVIDDRQDLGADLLTDHFAQKLSGSAR